MLPRVSDEMALPCLPSRRKKSNCCCTGAQKCSDRALWRVHRQDAQPPTLQPAASFSKDLAAAGVRMGGVSTNLCLMLIVPFSSKLTCSCSAVSFM